MPRHIIIGIAPFNLAKQNKHNDGYDDGNDDDYDDDVITVAADDDHHYC